MTSYALITGASSGIGLAMAEALARQGRPLILLARDRERLNLLALELRDRFKVDVLICACDLTEQVQLSCLLQDFTDNWPIDLLVNCAGGAESGSFIGHDWRSERKKLELNVVALTRLCLELGRKMARQGGGQILNVSSVAAFQPMPLLASYAASKSYVMNFSEALREELAPWNVQVSVLCPGPVDTAFWTSAGLCQAAIPVGGWMMRPEAVADAALRGLQKGRALIIPGWRNQLLYLLVRLAPRAVSRRIAGLLTQQLKYPQR